MMTLEYPVYSLLNCAMAADQGNNSLTIRIPASNLRSVNVNYAPFPYIKKRT